MSIPTAGKIAEDLIHSAEVGSPYTYETVGGSHFVQTYDDNGDKGPRYPLTIIIGLKEGPMGLTANTHNGVPCTEIDVPSGKLIVADNLGRVDAFNIEPPMSIMTGAGTDAWAQLMATQANTAYAFVGNSCPSVIRTASGALEVITFAWDEEDRPVLNEGEEKVGWICTDLWAAMATDYQNWLDHGGPDIAVANEPYGLDVFTVIDVTPGRYRWIAYSHVDSFDMDARGRVTYARLERIEDDRA